mgnify:CR=1 FL=1
MPFIGFGQDKFTTFYEKSNFSETPRYEETIEFCKLLDKTSPYIYYTSFGKSPQGRDLPLLIADKNGNNTADKIRKSGNVILLIQACIHAGETDGKDAVLMLLRDIVTQKIKPELLDHVSILFIPIFNVDGHERFGAYNRINQNGPKEMGWRTTAQNLNMNRDYLKADTPEMQAWLKLYSTWLPEFFIDCHVTDGADYQYHLTYSLPINGNLDNNLSKWIATRVEPYLTTNMDKNGMPIFPYVEYRNWHDPRSGLTNLYAPAMLSHGYTLLQNRPSLLIETHMLKPYKTRVEATYQMIKSVINLLNSDYKELKKLTSEADTYVSTETFSKKPFALSYKQSFADSTFISFKGYEYTCEKSDLTGGEWFKYDNTKPVTWELTYFPFSKPAREIALPEAYVIPPQYGEIINRLKLHGVQMRTLNHDSTMKVEMTRFSNIDWQAPYEGRHKTTYQLHNEIVTQNFPKGSIYISIHQRLAKLIAYALEPACPDSYASWGFFNAVMEQKEYGESYVLESMAREMMQKDSTLKTQWEKEKALHSDLYKDPYAILNWFYSKSPYWDKNYNLYPIGRIIKN